MKTKKQKRRQSRRTSRKENLTDVRDSVHSTSVPLDGASTPTETRTERTRRLAHHAPQEKKLTVDGYKESKTKTKKQRQQTNTKIRVCARDTTKERKRSHDDANLENTKNVSKLQFLTDTLGKKNQKPSPTRVLA